MMYYILFSRKLNKTELDSMFNEIKVIDPGFLFFGYDVKAVIAPNYLIDYISIDPNTYILRKCDPMITLVECDIVNPPEFSLFNSSNNSTKPSESDIKSVLNKLYQLPFVIDVIISDIKPTYEQIILRLLNQEIIAKKSSVINSVLTNLFTQSEPITLKTISSKISNQTPIAENTIPIKNILPWIFLSLTVILIFFLRRG